MERMKAWQTPLTILGIIVVFGLLTATWSGVSNALFSGNNGGAEASSEPLEAEDVIVDIDGMFYTTAGDYLFNIDAIREFDDTPVSGLVILGILTVIIVGGVFAIGLLLMLLTRAGDRTVTNLKDDDEYKAALANMEKAEKEYIKTNKSASPPRDKRGNEQPLKWSAVSTGLSAVLLSYFFGVVVGAEIPGAEASTMGTIFAVVGAGISAYMLRPEKMAHVDDNDFDPSPRGTLWVMLSGALVLGLGMGFMFAVINGQDPFPFLDPIWWQENIIGPLTS